MKETHTDVLIVGGGTGGCAAAMAVASLGLRVVLTEETLWLGGQLTAQAVPPDEHPWIEHLGCTARYRRYRDLVRQYYREHYPLSATARRQPHLNPGLGTVSRLCHEPRVGLAVIESMLAYARTRGLLAVRLRRKPVSTQSSGDRVQAVMLRNLDSDELEVVWAHYVLDATELGDLLPLAGVEYVSGAESQRDTGEPHAVAGPAQPDNVQAITWCFPLAYDPAPGADHRIARPEQYAFWRDLVPDLRPSWPGRLLDVADTHPITLKPRRRPLFPHQEGQPGFDAGSSWWRYRRLVTREHYDPGVMEHEVTLVNWPRNDYFLGNIIDKPEEEVARHLHAAKQLSLSLLYWLQNDMPHLDPGTPGTPGDGTGYPGLYLRPDMTGTDDGLAMYPYIRESRRIRAQFTVLEQHVGTEVRGGYDSKSGKPRPEKYDPAPRAEPFFDSVGVGSYRIDLHMSTGGDNYIDISSLPFQIPLGALLPVRVENLLPACKNLGVTHITNGCYRLHPVEWNIGEAAGLLAGYCLQHKTAPRQVRNNRDLLAEFQRLLVAQGIELAWPAFTPR